MNRSCVPSGARWMHNGVSFQISLSWQVRAKSMRTAASGLGEIPASLRGLQCLSESAFLWCMNALTRRRFLHAFSGSAAVLMLPRLGTAAVPSADLRVQRIRGLMLGTALGDALGGPIEFQPRDAVQRLPDPPKIWRDDEVLDAPALSATTRRLRLRGYRQLRPKPESYGQWNHDSLPGTITDDTRHKLILLHALRLAEKKDGWPVSARDFARAYVDWPATAAVTDKPEYVSLAADWLEEYQFAARWVAGERDLAKARPPERLWNGLPTCAGQMALLPIGAVFAGDPERAYRAAYELAFIDNGWGKDMIGALVAGLAAPELRFALNW